MGKFFPIIDWFLDWLKPDYPELEGEREGAGSRTWRKFTTQQEGIARQRCYGKTLHEEGNIVTTWTGIDGNERETANIICEFGDGPIKGKTTNPVYLNDLPSTSYGSVTIQERLGTMDQNCMTGFEQSKLQTQKDEELLYDVYSSSYFTTRDTIDDLEFTFEFPNGLRKKHYNGDFSPVVMTSHLQIRPVGGGWDTIVIGNTTENKNTPFYKLYKINTLDPGTIVHGTFYELRWKKLNHDSTEKYIQDLSLRSIREVTNDARTYPGKVLIGITAIANKKLSGNLSIKVVLEDRIVQNVITGALEYSRNRSSVAYDIATLPCIAGNGNDGTYNPTATPIPYSIERYDGLNPQQLDLAGFFQPWATFCGEEISDGNGGAGTEPRCPCDLQIKDYTDIFSLVHKIATVGRAKTYWSGNLLTGWIDDAVANVVDLITMDVIMYKTWKSSWKNRAEAFGVVEVMFDDSTQGYERTPASAASLDAGGFRNIQSVEGVGLTTRGAVIHYANYLLERELLIDNINTFEVAKEGFRYKLGHAVRVQNRVANWGSAFRVISSTADTITVDRDVTSEVSALDALYIRTYDTDSKTVITGTYVVDSVLGCVITVTVNWTANQTPVKGNVVATGTTVLRRIIDITPSSKNYFLVRVETYDSDLFDSDLTDPANPNPGYAWPGPAGIINKPLTPEQIEGLIISNIRLLANMNMAVTSNVTWNDDTPEDEDISWTATDGDEPILITFAGVTYEITASSTGEEFIYWDPDGTTTILNHTNTLATAISGRRRLMCTNEGGTAHPTPVGQQVTHGGLIQVGTITAAYGQIGALAVDTAQIANAAITNAKIGALAVDTAQIANAAITNAKIGNLAVESANIKNLAVDSAKIANLTVGTGKIANNATHKESSNTGSHSINNATMVTVLSTTIPSDGHLVSVMAVLELTHADVVQSQVWWRLVRGGTVLDYGDTFITNVNGQKVTGKLMAMDVPGSGNQKYDIQCMEAPGAYWTVTTATIHAIEHLGK